jgi:hypothetical protein
MDAWLPVRVSRNMVRLRWCLTRLSRYRGRSTAAWAGVTDW